jgi:hypothetical protein
LRPILYLRPSTALDLRVYWLGPGTFLGLAKLLLDPVPNAQVGFLSLTV